MGVANGQGPLGLDYVGAGLAIQSVDISGMDAGIALVLNAGKAMPDVSPSFSIEGEFTYTMSPASADVNDFFGSYSMEASIMTLAGYGVYGAELSPGLTGRVRAGLLYESVDFEVSSSSSSSSASDSEIGLSLGAGIAYELSDTMNITADWTIIEADVSHLSAGVQFKF